jgi:hypothetical protein
MWIVVPIEYRREQPMLFSRWIRSVRAIASKPHNSVTVSSRFMQEYVGSSAGDADGRSKLPALGCQVHVLLHWDAAAGHASLARCCA